MSNLHAAIGLAQTEKADFYRARRIKNGMLYRERLKHVPGILLQEQQADSLGVFWMNGVVLTPDYGHSRTELCAYLKTHGVDTRLFFNGMHRQPALKKYGCDCGGQYPVSDHLADNGLYLPSGSGLSEDDVIYVCDLIGNFSGSCC